MVDTVVIKQEQPTDDPAHIEAMVKKVDDANTSAADQTAAEVPKERPSWLPEKFGSVEDMAKAYAELEARQSGKREAAPVEAPAVQADQAEAAKVLSDKGLDFGAFSNEFAESGELSEASYEKLAAAGLPKGMVDQYIAAVS